MWRLRALREGYASSTAGQLARTRAYKRARPRSRGLRSEAIHDATAAAPRDSLLQRYSRLLETNPIATKAMTAAAIAGMGDIGCQLYTSRMLARLELEQQEGDEREGEAAGGGRRAQQQLDWLRCAKFALLSGALFAPSAHVWYGALGRWAPGATLQAAVQRMALDQFVFSPAFVAVFFSALMVLEGDAAKIPQKLRQDYWTTLVSNWSLWMPAQLINFRMVPLRFQVLFANGVGLLWNFYLSGKSFKKLDALPPPAEQPQQKSSASAKAAGTSAALVARSGSATSMAPGRAGSGVAAAPEPPVEVRVATRKS